MKKIVQAQLREIITEFENEIREVRIDTGKTDIINFRDDIEKGINRKIYRIPTSYLRFRKDNGRIASDVYTYENSKGQLIESTDYAQGILRYYLEKKDPQKTKVLKREIAKNGQLQVAVATADGFLINGNRRKMVLESLQQEYPKESKFDFLLVVILPGNIDAEESPSLKEIEQIENRYQLQVLGKAEYYNFDKAISIKRKIELGMTLEEQLHDDPNFFELTPKQFLNKMQKFRDEYIGPLEAIDRYLLYFDRKGHYNTISEGRTDVQGRWQAFRDYHNNVYKRLTDAQYRRNSGLRKNEISTIEEICFKIIRLRDLGLLRKKLHTVIRQIIKIIENKNSKKIFYQLRGKKEFLLEEWETINEQGNLLDERTKDIIWSKKYGEFIISKLVNVFEILDKRDKIESPVNFLNSIHDKMLKHPNLGLSINPDNLNQVKIIFEKIKNYLNEIEEQLLKINH